MSNKIPDKHIKNLTKIKVIIRDFNNHGDNIVDIANICSDYCLIFNRLPKYIQDKTYLREFYNQCESFLSSVQSHINQLSEISNKFIDFDNSIIELRKFYFEQNGYEYTDEDFDDEVNMIKS